MKAYRATTSVSSLISEDCHSNAASRYGVSRVYDQQCSYVLSDTQAAQNNLRALSKVVKAAELDLDARKIRPDQLILMDDPAFLPDLALPALDFDFTDLDVHTFRASQRSSNLSFLSPGQQPRQSTASRASSVLGLIIPTSDTGGYQLPMQFSSQGSSAHKPFSTREGSFAGRLHPEEDLILEEDLDFGFDDDGNLRDISPAGREAHRTDNLVPRFGRIDSDSLASGRVRREHEEAAAERAGRSLDIGLEDDNFVRFGDEDFRLPEAEAFPSGTIQGAKRARPAGSDATLESSSMTEDANARSKTRQKRTKRAVPQDAQIAYSHAQLRQFNNSYLTDMTNAKRGKAARAEAAQAKKNAYNSIWGFGIGGVGQGVGYAQFESPLSMFAGEKLSALITGITIQKPVRGKRTRADTDAETRRIRQRTGEGGIAGDDGFQVGRGEDESITPQFDDSGAEIGREGQSVIDDHHSSAMPWNVSASLHSYRAGSSVRVRGVSSIGSAVGAGKHSSIHDGRPGSRLTSASPLFGRGRLDLSTSPGGLQDIQRMDDYELPALTFDSEGVGSVPGSIPGGRESEVPRAGLQHTDLTRDEEFEIWGPAANVDTQTAGTSQWMGEAMAREATNFLSYVRNTITEMQADELDDGSRAAGMDATVSFKTLIPPLDNTTLVAAQAFYHVLTLASQSAIVVVQGAGFDDDIHLFVRDDEVAIS
ncbi:MAG: hypothetical protein M1818_007626 [Claussenomyces sp. TS43310]|nr:MAG: hypothetical protein M1818_007626 [Claussenomyces sp. TS43310]